jgi:hypothetical protein
MRVARPWGAVQISGPTIEKNMLRLYAAYLSAMLCAIIPPCEPSAGTQTESSMIPRIAIT